MKVTLRGTGKPKPGRPKGLHCLSVFICGHSCSAAPAASPYFALSRFANSRNAPGTPPGNCRNQAYDVKMYTPFP